MDNQLQRDIEHRFAGLCTEVGRCGVIGFAPLEGVRLLPEQSRRLQEKLGALARPSECSAISFGLFYYEREVLAIPATWRRKAAHERWNDYARAYRELNRTLDHVSTAIAAEFGGVAEKATIEGWAGTVQHVGDYFAHCISHRAFAEAARLGWRGRHGLIVTPEAGPALRFATVFVPYRVPSAKRELAGCGDCRACLDICPILRKIGPADFANSATPQIPRRTRSAAAKNAGRSTGDTESSSDSGNAGHRVPPPFERGSTRDYREACRRRIDALGLAADVCGICVRVCWESVCG